ncbi:hypothetical protein LPJ61_003275 [Coemansia biformis]|uniref:Uncharacterized protein n=1 Tax=Coemansia biformis TaxID=1286918 RepID=A0A9W8CYS7_9FUNG|nr:hypothetical protein LPJ61_003275 [Coemansia biformis]
MPLDTLDNDNASAATAADSEPRPTAAWQAGRAGRVRQLEAALAAVAKRQQAGDSRRRAPTPSPDYGSMLDGETGGDDSADAQSDAGSAFYGEGQPLLRTYQPAEYPRAAPMPPPKQPEQFLPWSHRLCGALRLICAPCCAQPDRD